MAAAPDDDVTSRYTALLSAYDEKDQQAQLAAEIGQRLLAQTQADAQEIERLKAALEALKQQLARAAQSATPPPASPPQHQLPDGASADALRSLDTKYQLLQRRFAEAEQANRQLLDDLQHLQGERAKESKDLEAARGRQRQLNAELEQARQQLQQVSSTNTVEQDQRRQHAKQLAERDAALQELRQADAKRSRQIADMQQAFDSERARAETSHKEVASLRTELSAAQARLADLRITNSKLEEAVATLALENQAVHSQATENLRMLDEARSATSSLRQRLELEAAAGDVKSGSPAPSSLLSELEAIEAKTNASASTSQLPSAAAAAAPLSSSLASATVAADGSVAAAPAPTLTLPSGGNSQEYFHLAASAIKIGIAVRYPQRKSNAVFSVSVNDAYTTALEEGIPFHEWHGWLERYFARKLGWEELQPGYAERMASEALKRREAAEAAAAASAAAAAAAPAPTSLFGRLKKLATEY